MLFTGIAAAALLAWVYLAAAHGEFWRVEPGSSREAALATPPPRVAVVIPARDEADVLGTAIASLLKQDFPGALHIFVVDDGSSDGTVVAARAAAPADKLTVISGTDLPAGWTGKMWAVAQGVERARASNPDFFLLTDADIAHGPDTVATLVARVTDGPYDLASYMVRLQCATAAERLLIPAFVYFFFLLYPPRRVRARRWRTAGAAGGCILIGRDALERAGGIEAIRSEIIDDCALAAAIKRNGGSVWLELAQSSQSLRPYGSFGEIDRMVARTAFKQLHHSVLLLTGCLTGLLLAFVAPVALLFTGRALPAVLAAAAWVLMSLTYLPMVRFYRLNALRALTLPLAAVFYMVATIHSAMNYWLGRGGQWKGRAQDVAAP